MSYALVANLDPIYGLYSGTFPVLVYGLFGTSRQLSVGPVAIVSLIIGEGIGEIVHPRLEDGSQNPLFVQLAITAAFLSGVLQMAMGLMKLGFVTRLLSHPVLSGFTSGAALIIGLGQVQHIVAFSPKPTSNLFLLIGELLVRMKEAHWPSVVMGVGVIVILQTFKTVKRLKMVPAGFFVVVLGIVFSYTLNLQSKYGFKVTGKVPPGVPAATLPTFPSEHLGTMMSIVVVASMIGQCHSVSPHRVT